MFVKFVTCCSFVFDKIVTFGFAVIADVEEVIIQFDEDFDFIVCEHSAFRG